MGRITRFGAIKKSAEFNRIYRIGKRWHDGAFVLFVLPDVKQSKAGFVASKKIGNAVKRVRAKRRLRALFLKMAPLLKNGEYVLVAKPPVLDLPFSTLEASIKRAVKRLDIGQ